MTASQNLRFRSYIWMLSVLMICANIAVQEPAFGFSTNVKSPFFPIHEFITDVSLRLTKGKFSNGDPVYFSDVAIKEISENNVWVDRLYEDVKSDHFDNETLIIGSKYLVSLRQEIIADLSTSPSQDSIWLDLGWMLHPIQDFYSHSNWINVTAPGTINSSFGFDVNSVFETRSEIGNTCESDASTLQPQFMNGPVLPKKITTGYFFGFPAWKSDGLRAIGDQVLQKCLHGMRPGNIILRWAAGIHKDLPEANIAEFADARTRAIEASRALIQGILDEMEGNDKALCTLTGSKNVVCKRTELPPPGERPLYFQGQVVASANSGIGCGGKDETIQGQQSASASASHSCEKERYPGVIWKYSGNATAAYSIATGPTGKSGEFSALASGRRSPENSNGGTAATSISVTAELKSSQLSCYQANAYVNGSKSASTAGIYSDISISVLDLSDNKTLVLNVDVNLSRFLERESGTDQDSIIGTVRAGERVSITFFVTGGYAFSDQNIAMNGNFDVRLFAPNGDGSCGD